MPPYVLTLPYYYSLPLLIASAVLHWLISQVLFVIQTRDFIYDLTLQGGYRVVHLDALDGSVIGYSAISLIFALVMVVEISMSIAILAMKPLPSRETQLVNDGAEANRSFLVIRMPLASTKPASWSRT
ncbi:hypothetical protein HD806DRAFT_485868 [Xylariaceae sp. AK1471]|nr:hypothetical protein HD806DRAFT_485868 [Xylariaceae sp. AK1471]